MRTTARTDRLEQMPTRVAIRRPKYARVRKTDRTNQER